MRLFAALPLPRRVTASLREVQEALRSRGVRGRFTPEENLHLTLAFIGEYADLPRVKAALEQVSFDAMELSLSSSGAFGDILWAGLEKSGALEALAVKVRQALIRAEIPCDAKGFSPHITLARRARGGASLSREAVTVPAQRFRADRFVLFRSDRGDHGMIYTPLETFYAGRENP